MNILKKFPSFLAAQSGHNRVTLLLQYHASCDQAMGIVVDEQNTGMHYGVCFH